MKKLILGIIIGVIAISFISCETLKTVTVITYSKPLAQNEYVEVFTKFQKLPEGLKHLGNVKIGNAGFTTKCSYDEVVSDAQQKAREIGGNIIYIIEHFEPNMYTRTCHSITAEIYLKN